MTTSKEHLVPIQVITIGEELLECHLDKHKHPFIMYNGVTYQDLHKLMDAIPAFKHAKDLDSLARMANFLFKGNAYQYIDNISEFREEYLNQIEFEKNSMDYIPMRLIDHGVFDTSGMHPPRIIDSEFVFFAKDDHTGLPYQVSCPFPIPYAVRANYNLLPYAK